MTKRTMVGLMFVLYAGIAAAQASEPDGLAGWLGFSIGDWLKFGAIGLMAFGLVLGHSLLRNDKQVPGYVFLGVVLVAASLFVWVEWDRARIGIDIVLAPHVYDPAHLAPKLVVNESNLELSSGRKTVPCDDRVMLTIDVDALSTAAEKALHGMGEALSVTTASRSGEVGMDREAGGAQ